MVQSGPIKALAVLPEEQGALALTGGQDHTVLLCRVPALDSGAAAAEPARPMAVYRCSCQAQHRWRPALLSQL